MTQDDPSPQRTGAPPLSRPPMTPIYRIVQQIVRFLMTVFYDLKVYGRWNVPATGGVLLASNHQSFLDPVVLAIGSQDRMLSFLAKSELFKNPVFGRLIWALNAFPVEQGSGDVGAVKESIRRLADGHMLNVFPEGSRTPDGDIHPLEKGVGLVIRRAKVTVVPVVVDGSFEAWPRFRPGPRCHPIRVMFGTPIEGLWELGREEILEKLSVTLKRMLDDLRAGKIPPEPPRPIGR